MSSVGTWLHAHTDLDRLDREVLVCRAAGLNRVQVLSRPELPLPSQVVKCLDDWAARRRRGEPIAYITGRKEFWGIELQVSPDVLIPRPETELLVEETVKAVAAAGSAGEVEVLELGTGSGAVAIAVAGESAARRLAARITATDRSPAAVAVAAQNAHRAGVAIRWVVSDWFAALRGSFHVVTSNPPYVAEDDPHLPALAHEPRAALVAGPDGLEALGAIIAAAPAHLHPGGWLLLEHGFDQGPAVRALLAASGFQDVHTEPDLAGLDRVTRGRKPGSTP